MNPPEIPPVWNVSIGIAKAPNEFLNPTSRIKALQWAPVSLAENKHTSPPQLAQLMP